MPQTSKTQLNPYESAALTRLVMSYCLGKGGICLYSRSYVLQIAQPGRCGDYAHYQWRRLCQFIPTAKPPRFYPVDSTTPLAEAADPAGLRGQWRIRLTSRWFETAYNMLYPLEQRDPLTGFRPFRVEQSSLDLLGAEAIASLWADRGRVLKGTGRLRGQLNLSRVTFPEAELIQQWIGRLTGATSTLATSPRNAEAPMLFLEQDDVLTLLQALRPTWMAQAPCLTAKFQPEIPPPPKPHRNRKGGQRERRQFLEQCVEQGSPLPEGLVLERKGNRKVPTPRPLHPPLLKKIG